MKLIIFNVCAPLLHLNVFIRYFSVNGIELRGWLLVTATAGEAKENAKEEKEEAAEEAARGVGVVGTRGRRRVARSCAGGRHHHRLSRVQRGGGRDTRGECTLLRVITFCDVANIIFLLHILILPMLFD
jgi:hypothetical protein